MEGSTLLDSGNTKRYDIPVGHLDYGYIEKCKDSKMLEKIYKVLKSGDEGCFPDLERFCEEKLAQLNPNSRALRKEIPVSSRKDLRREDRETLDEDLKSWTDSMKTIEDHLKTPPGPVLNEDDESDLPPIRSGNITLTADGAKTKKSEDQSSTKRVMPREYRDWDNWDTHIQVLCKQCIPRSECSPRSPLIRICPVCHVKTYLWKTPLESKIDVDKELEKIDTDDDKTKGKTVAGNTVIKDIPSHIDSKGLSDSEKLMKANREKDKGNEAFRANDFKEAITYYSRSISLQPTAASYNNRALAYLKNTDWQKALADCNKVLSMEPDNVKALLRRGTAYKSLKKYDTAIADLNKVIELEPNNKRAKDLKEETEKTIQKEKEERKSKGRRMKIEDVDEMEEETESETQTPPTNVKTETETVEPVKSKSRKMKIEEVEDDEEEEEETPDVRVNNDIDDKEISPKVDDKPMVNGFPDSNAGANDKNAGVNVKSDIGEPQVCAETNAEDDKGDQTDEIVREKLLECQSTTDENTESNSLKNNVDSKEPESEKTKKEVTEECVAEEAKGDTDDSQTKDSDTEESAENTETAEESVPQTLSRPVFYMKEYPASCQKLRDEANALFKSGQYGDATEKYSRVIHLLEKMPDQVFNLSLIYSNKAACQLKTGNLPGCVKDCNSSLELVPHSIKPLLRRATAYEHLERYKKAYTEYRHVLLLDSRTEQAHLGVKRCQAILLGRDGPRWREKVQLTQVSPWDVPEIIGLDGKPTVPAVFPTQVPASSGPSTSSSQGSSVSSTPGAASKPEQTVPCSSAAVSESKPKKTEVREPVKTEVRETEKSPQEKFDMLKAKGNEHVKNGQFRDAIQYYSECVEVLPDQTVSYTNRALCYIRINKPDKAEEDCTTALAAEKDNVKALFRRAQARKMLKRYREGIEDLKHLLDVDPKNSAAKKEMDLLKTYWREELEGMKKNMPKKQEPKPGTNKQESKPCPRAAQSGAGKQRKKMVIEEVDSEEEPSEQDNSSHTQKSAQEHKHGPKVQEVQSKPVNQKSSSKPVSNAKPVQTKSDAKTKPVNKKSQIKATSSDIPQVPRSVPKLDKATPYEFISAWNALKNTETVKPYYELLKQIKPADIKTVISNKLDGNMLNVITKCVAEHYIANGEEDESYLILKNLSTVPRFGTMAMFMSGKEKSDVQAVMERLASHKSSVYSADDIQKLRRQYSV